MTPSSFFFSLWKVLRSVGEGSGQQWHSTASSAHLCGDLFVVKEEKTSPSHYLSSAIVKCRKAERKAVPPSNVDGVISNPRLWSHTDYNDADCLFLFYSLSFFVFVFKSTAEPRSSKTEGKRSLSSLFSFLFF